MKNKLYKSPRMISSTGNRHAATKWYVEMKSYNLTTACLKTRLLTLRITKKVHMQMSPDPFLLWRWDLGMRPLCIRLYMIFNACIRVVAMSMHKDTESDFNTFPGVESWLVDLV